MKVKFLRTVGLKDVRGEDGKPGLPAKPDGTPYQEGEVADLKDKDAQAFLAAGLAAAADSPEAKAAAAEPEEAKAKAGHAAHHGEKK